MSEQGENDMTLEKNEAPDPAEVVGEIKASVLDIQHKADKKYRELAEATTLLDLRKAAKQDVTDIQVRVVGITDDIKTLLPRVEAAEKAIWVAALALVCALAALAVGIIKP